ncbi:unnamed protein product [Amoebophrya sp. A120]|nr:unnamed protein product [Amoebophrya sp. A120]|eukprot:GSA120T00018031001.1
MQKYRSCTTSSAMIARRSCRPVTGKGKGRGARVGSTKIALSASAMITRLTAAVFATSSGVLWTFWSAAGFSFAAATPDISEYLILSQPRERALSYLHLSSKSDDNAVELKPLVRAGLVTPTAVVVDPDRMRLFVADSGLGKIVYYNLAELQAGKLITDGHQNLAVDSVEADGIAVSKEGDLYFDGKLLLPPPDAMAAKAVFLQPRAAFESARFFNPTLLYDAGFAGASRLAAPGPLAVDTNHVYWGNAAAGGDGANPTVVRGPLVPAHAAPKPAPKLDSHRTSEATYGWGDAQAVRETDFLARPAAADEMKSAPEEGVKVALLSTSADTAHILPEPLAGESAALFEVANTTNGVHALCLSAKNVFFASGETVFVSPKGQKYPRCDWFNPNSCLPVTKDAVKPESLLWDGDGSVYVVDSHKPTKDGMGGVFKIPAGDTRAHNMEYIQHVPSVHGIAYLQFSGDDEKPAAPTQVEQLVSSVVSSFFS